MVQYDDTLKLPFTGDKSQSPKPYWNAWIQQLPGVSKDVCTDNELVLNEWFSQTSVKGMWASAGPHTQFASHCIPGRGQKSCGSAFSSTIHSKVSMKSNKWEVGGNTYCSHISGTCPHEQPHSLVFLSRICYKLSFLLTCSLTHLLKLKT